jgi:hypothetical protein
MTTSFKDIIPIAMLGQYVKDDILHPAAQILNEHQDVAFDPAFVAGCLITLYEAFLSHVPDSKQIDFEKQFRFYLINMFNNKEQYTITLSDSDNQTNS